MRPHRQTERDLLAAILRKPELIVEAQSLDPSDFGLEANGVVFGAMRAVCDRGATLDHRTLRLQLEQIGKLEVIGGWPAISELIDSDQPLLGAGPFVQAIREASVKRRAFDVVERFHNDLLVPGSAAEAISQTVADLSKLADGGSEATLCEGAGLLRESTRAVETLLSGDGLGRSTGFLELDRLNLRLVPGEVIVIAAGTSRGKSALGAQIAYHVAKNEGRAAFVSLEMSKVQTLRRFVALEARVPLDVMRANADSAPMAQKLTRALSCIGSSRLIVADLSRDSRLSRVVASAQAAKARGGLDVLVIDYLGLLNLDGPRNRASRYEVVTELSREVKLAALRLNVAVILLAQFSREPEKREGGRPQLSDLRDSGAIEQDADAVILIHRAALASEGALLVAKNRNGPLGEVPITFDGPIFTFREQLAG